MTGRGPSRPDRDGPSPKDRRADMTEPEEVPDDTGAGEPIEAAPTANPARVRVPPEGLKQHPPNEGEPASGPPPGEEA
ncbi:hypothetical protein EAD96_17465 [Micromonospora sp. BL1]|uniref:Uncharacterized protein n=2 Tax=Micromonosporaceae TaxID=28056 RepID=A0A386WII2_9ACTN|nr:hypothetical protein CSH63_10565 [Micromonospora tulbaghiae]RLQ03834.1 hypothetical protein EAD96_17465 [Micromonospora sp. BL1]